jgi:hypothetical protein
MKNIPVFKNDKLQPPAPRPLPDFKSKLHAPVFAPKRSHVPIGRCYGRPRG